MGDTYKHTKSACQAVIYVTLYVIKSYVVLDGYHAT